MASGVRSPRFGTPSAPVSVRVERGLGLQPRIGRFHGFPAKAAAALLLLGACAGKSSLPGAYELQSYSPEGPYGQPVTRDGFSVRLLLTPEAKFSLTVHDNDGTEVTTTGSYQVEDGRLVLSGDDDRGTLRVSYVVSRDGLVLTLPRAELGVWGIDAIALNFKRR